MIPGTNSQWASFLDNLQELSGSYSQSERDGFPQDLWNALGASSIFGTLRAHGVGSDGVSTTMRMLRELGRQSPDRGLSFSAVTQLASTIYCLRAFASEELQERYLPDAESGEAIGAHAITESGAGSDVMSMATTATLKGDEYVIDGTKQFITNAPVASTIIVYAKTVEGGEQKGVSAFLVETKQSGVDTSRVMPTAGLRTSPIGEVVMSGVRVPKANRIGYPGGGMLILDQVMKREILFAFAANIGEMEQSVRQSVRRVNERKQFGVTIGSNQLVSAHIVQSQIAIELGGALLESIASRLDGFEDVTVATAAAKIFLSEANIDCAIGALQIHGGQGYLSNQPLAARLLDAVPGTIYSGSNDVLRTKIATLIGIQS